MARGHSARRTAVLVALLLLACAGGAGAAPPDPDGQTAFHGWPVWPLHRQHPIRGGFMDPRGSNQRAIFHTGIDISVRDGRPERGHPAGRTHRVYALESGTASIAQNVADLNCHFRSVRVGSWVYGHVDPVGTLESGQQVDAGQQVGWTCRTLFHVHLAHTISSGGRQVWDNPLRTGVLQPYVDMARPVIHGIRFLPPAPVKWFSWGGSISSLVDVAPLDPMHLQGTVNVDASVSDPQSFRGWLAKFPVLLADQVPYSIRFAVTREEDGVRVAGGNPFRADAVPTDPALNGAVFAGGTAENLSTWSCIDLRLTNCAGTYWFHLFRGGWDTTTVPNGGYRICVDAYDAMLNHARSCTRVGVAN
jgi:hypothetical protein